MNGPLKMYETKQVIRHDLPVTVPNCMYKMKNILSDNKINSCEHVLAANKNLDISEQKYQIHPEMAQLQLRQENILKQLAELKEHMQLLRSTLNITSKSVITNQFSNETKLSAVVSNEIKNISDLVINVSPTNPPYSLLVLQLLWAESVQINIRTYFHSSICTVSKVVQDFTNQINRVEINPKLPQLLIRLIWKEVDGNMELITSSLNMPIHGETNILRYFCRIGPNNWNYELMSNVTEIDSALDICYLLSRARTKTERHSLLQLLNGKLGKSQWLCNSNNITIADVVANSVIKQVTQSADVNVNLTKWMQRCENIYLIK